MDGVKPSSDKQTSTISTGANTVEHKVFQPPHLHEIVELIDLMGTVSTRVREDKKGDAPTAGGGTQSNATKSGTTARDEAIAKIPPPAIMQKKLVEHIRQEVRNIEREAKRLSRSNKRGSAYMLSELYRKIRRLSTLMKDMFEASADMIKRFYVSVFIDHHPLVITDGVGKDK